MIKKVLATALLCIFCICAFAQEHASFKGITLDQSVNSFNEELKKIGYRYSDKSEFQNFDVFEFKGNFAGMSDCEIWVYGMKNNGIVFKVIVVSDDYEQWYSIKTQYNTIKNAMTDKYGKPENDFHFFSSPYYEGDGYEMSALKQDKCTYAAYWHINGNTIVVRMHKSKCIHIVYQDDSNMEIYNGYSSDQLKNDL